MKEGSAAGKIKIVFFLKYKHNGMNNITFTLASQTESVYWVQTRKKGRYYI